MSMTWRELFCLILGIEDKEEKPKSKTTKAELKLKEKGEKK